ncbi:MAG: cytochrome c-type biogenesis protein CcmH [Candidatus Nitricoxidivorans perseverans]|uniref:Cytochrome c-type biogenesis protein n=1 Tax=Candidatus Nitricoxidivorans perseverans TaxID=2975601 RepID=A0AA49IXM6_9PROT|nr:MAG: cytochrome c-type biogenesis protein CcmH [Candidatus Nitricoxidivorans perseverans]
MIRVLALLLALFISGIPLAKEAAPLAEDEAIEKRLTAIAEELRCLVCQNESLAGSRADLAQDLRREVRTLMKEGKTDAEVKDFLVSRYGDFVLYRPPVKPTTWLLWAGPFLLLAAGIATLIAYLRRRASRVTGVALSEEEAKRAEALLGDGR